MPRRASAGARSGGGWMERLEGRQMFWAPLCGPPSVPPANPPTNPQTPPPVVQLPAGQAPLPWPLPAEPFTPRPPYAPPPVTTPPVPPTVAELIGTYAGPFGSLIGTDSGVFTITVIGGKRGTFDATFSYDGAGRKLSVPAKLIMGENGAFTMKYVSPKAVVQVNGVFDLKSGRVGGDFQVWDRSTTYRAAFTLTKGAGRV